jgi:hypothetical protein
MKAPRIQSFFLPRFFFALGLTRGLTLFLTIVLSGSISAETIHEINPEIGTHTWKRTSDHVSYSFTQILPDQLRAFYDGRGFPQEAAEEFALSCVFMVVVRNGNEEGAIEFETGYWRIISNGQENQLRSINSWMDRWRAIGLETPQLVAFRWAQFPASQEYLPGDWNQGMLSVGLGAGERFDMMLQWNYQGKSYKGRLHDVTCAE